MCASAGQCHQLPRHCSAQCPRVYRHCVRQCRPVPPAPPALQCPVSPILLARQRLCPVPAALSASWDATESRAWVELLHRKWRANNRFDAWTAEQKACRLGCELEESMLHMITCRKAAPLWDACFNFSKALLVTSLTRGEIARVIIFNMDAGGNMKKITRRRRS